jgi:hypothetical protein
MQRLTTTHGLGIAVIALAALALVLWVPNDVVSGYLVSKRGRVSIGDSMAPGLALGLMVLSGALILCEARKTQAQGRPDGRSLGFLVVMLAICLCTFGVMIWAGPMAVALFKPEETYRNLRDTAPWKYLGFALGGTGLVAVLIGLATVACLIGIFDLAFDDLLLPPNGDQ